MAIKTDLPVKPRIGLQFRPDGTNSVGTILSINKREVTYSYDHDPSATYSAPYSDVRNLGWMHRA